MTWADGVYWLRVVSERSDGTVIVENLNDAGKLTVEKIREAIEPDLLLPFVPWASIDRWRAEATHSLLLPHNAESGYLAIPEKEMRERYPRTLTYLYRFKGLLEQRSGYRQLRQGQPFYICGNTGTPFRSPFKLIWRSMGTEVKAAILRERDWFGHRAPEVHKNTVSFVPFEREDEALYLCGMLNSSFVTTYALASSVRGGKSFAGTGLLGTVAVPKFDLRSREHARVVELAAQAVADPAADDRDALDRAAGDVWGFTETAVARVSETREAFAPVAIPELPLPEVQRPLGHIT